MDASLRLLVFAAVRLGAMLALAVCLTVVGRRAARGIRWSSPTEELVVSFALGMGVAGSAVFVLGLLGALQPGIVLVLVAVGLVLGRREWRDLSSSAQQIWRHLRYGDSALPALVLISGSLPMLVLALYPPFGFDATLYHLPYAQAFVELGRLAFLEDLRFPVFPQLNEMLFVLPLMFGDDILPGLLQATAAASVAIVLWTWGRRWGEARAGLMAAALWLGTPLVVWIGASAYIDMGLTLFVTCSLYSFERWWRSRDDGWLVLASAFAGFAAGSKYLGLFVVLALFMALVAFRCRPRSLVVFAAVVLAVGGPWYLRNFLYTGNPLFPFYSGLFGVSEWLTLHDRLLEVDSASRAGRSSLVVAQLGRVVRDLPFLFLVPWNAVFRRELFHFAAPISPWWIVLVPGGLLPAIRDRRTRIYLGLAAAYCLLWLTTVREIRFLLPLAPILGMTLIEPLIRWSPLRLLLQRRGASGLLTAALLLPGLSYGMYKVVELGPVPVTEAARERFLASRLAGYAELADLHRRLEDRYTVYTLFGENLRYYCRGTCLGDWWGLHPYDRILEVADDGEEIYDVLRSMEVDHLLVVRSAAGAGIAEGALAGRHFRLVSSSARAELYALDGAGQSNDEAN